VSEWQVDEPTKAEIDRILRETISRIHGTAGT
jgi:hypothetical protein